MTVATTSLDLSKVRISPLRSDFVLRGFTCGDHGIDKWIVGKAVKHHAAYRARVFCAHFEDSTTVLGLYSLSMSIEEVNKLEHDERRHLKPGGQFPVIYLQALSVISRYQKNKLGTILFIDALRRAHMIAQNVAVYGIALRSLNERTTKLYSKYGFGLRENDVLYPMMILPIWSLNDLISSPGN